MAEGKPTKKISGVSKAVERTCYSNTEAVSMHHWTHTKQCFSNRIRTNGWDTLILTQFSNSTVLSFPLPFLSTRAGSPYPGSAWWISCLCCGALWPAKVNTPWCPVFPRRGSHVWGRWVHMTTVWEWNRSVCWRLMDCDGIVFLYFSPPCPISSSGSWWLWIPRVLWELGPGVGGLRSQCLLNWYRCPNHITEGTCCIIIENLFYCS